VERKEAYCNTSTNEKKKNFDGVTKQNGGIKDGEREEMNESPRMNEKRAHTAAPFTMLSDNVDTLHARFSGGMSGGSPPPPPLNTALGPRSCSGEGDGSGRAEPLRGGGERTVICCGERSTAGDGTTSYGPWGGGVDGGKGKRNAGEKIPSPTSGLCDDASGTGAVGGTVATGVSPSRWRKSASGAMCAMRPQIGVVGIDVGITRGGRIGEMTVDMGGGVERPEGALRLRRRCLSDVTRGTGSNDTGVDARDGDETGGGGSGPVGGGLGGTSNACGMV